MKERCGSYPFRYIAEDFGVPYSTVLLYADSQIGSTIVTTTNQHLIKAFKEVHELFKSDTEKRHAFWGRVKAANKLALPVGIEPIVSGPTTQRSNL